MIILRRGWITVSVQWCPLLANVCTYNPARLTVMRDNGRNHDSKKKFDVKKKDVKDRVIVSDVDEELE